MPLSWNENRHNAIRFAKDWAGVKREEAEKQTFWNEFFAAFGIQRRTVASFEEPVKNIRGQYGFIDLFWPKVVVVEHKSFGKDLGRAESQATRYIQDLAREGREKEIPRYIIVSDFARMALHDLEEKTSVTFPLAELHKRIHAFAFLPGYKQHTFEEQDPINIEATEILGELHDALEAGGYSGHNLERFLVRVLFCLFAEDTGIFEREAFKLYLENHTQEDGSDLGPHLARLFDILNREKRQANLDEDLAAFAEVALWLMDHQMNLQVSEAFGQLYQRLPLKKSPHIHCGNALRLDWKQVLPPAQCSYVLGNPPFIGAKFQNNEQRADMDAVAGDIENSGLLDYVTGWYFKAAEYIKGTRIVVGFVSTNSISQGEQVGVLWNPLFQQFGVTIHFAHRPFSWQSEARGKAHVHVIIVGFAAFDTTNKRIYDYEGRAGSPLPAADCQPARSGSPRRRARSDAPYQPTETVTVSAAKNVSPYLVEGSNIAVTNRSQPICDVPEMGIGNKPIDDGNYLFTPEEKAEFLKVEPAAKNYFRRWFGSIEFINNIERWGLWLGECPPSELRAMPHAMARVEAVQKFRLASKSEPTRKIAATPTRYHVENFPKRAFLIVPEVSSERRHYIPIGFMQPDALCSNLVKIVPDATPFHFGVLSSAMHMAWVRQVCGRMKSDYRYSNKLVYNNYPWPEAVSEKQRAAVEAAAQKVLSVRAEFLAPGARVVPTRSTSASKAPAKSRNATPDSRAADGGRPRSTATLADLYDPLATPPTLQKAHEELDRAVDKCYRPEPFTSERQRVEFLFALYEKLTAPLVVAAKSKRARRKKETVYGEMPPPPAPQHSDPNPDQAWADAAHFYFMAKEEPPKPGGK